MTGIHPDVSRGTVDPAAGRAVITSIGVVGAGVIGVSVAHAVAASTDLPVILVDRDAAALDEAAGSLRRHRRLARLTEIGARTEDLTMTTDLAALAEVDLAVENITEDIEAKRALYTRLDDVLRADAVIAANTSAIPVGLLAAALRDPSRVVGAHFMNPVDRTAMVEVIRPATASPRAVEALLDLLGRMGKEAVVVGDGPGFVINRALMPMVNLAAAIVADGTATAAEVDRLFRGCLGHRSGPLRTADLIGVDTVVRTLDVLHSQLGGTQYVAHPSLRRMVENGTVGVKSGSGFFGY
jgi:3-hydroxybutyryl-CoA dehydrogenase